MIDNKAYIGIDPGEKGGLVFIRPNGRIDYTPMPKTEEDIWVWLDTRTKHSEFGLRCVIEKVGGTVGKMQTGSSMFAFGAGYGGLRMALIACGFTEDNTFAAVHPLTWQAVFKLEKTPKSVPEKKRQAYHKKVLQRKAQELFPQLLVTAAVADALLLAYFAKHYYEWRV